MVLVELLSPAEGFINNNKSLVACRGIYYCLGGGGGGREDEDEGLLNVEINHHTRTHPSTLTHTQIHNLTHKNENTKISKQNLARVEGCIYGVCYNARIH